MAFVDALENQTAHYVVLGGVILAGIYFLLYSLGLKSNDSPGVIGAKVVSGVTGASDTGTESAAGVAAGAVATVIGNAGSVILAAGDAVKKALTPSPQTPEAQALINQGVTGVPNDYFIN